MELAINRTRIEIPGSLVDKVARPLEQDHSANYETCPKLTVHTKCSTECQKHLGNSWSGQKLQTSVPLDVGGGGKVSLAKLEI